MVNHATYPHVWGPLPASLEPGAYEALRGLGFDGVAITDALGMGAVHARFGFDRGPRDGGGGRCGRGAGEPGRGGRGAPHRAWSTPCARGASTRGGSTRPCSGSSACAASRPTASSAPPPERVLGEQPLHVGDPGGGIADQLHRGRQQAARRIAFQQVGTTGRVRPAVRLAPQAPGPHRGGRAPRTRAGPGRRTPAPSRRSRRRPAPTPASAPARAGCARCAASGSPGR